MFLCLGLGFLPAGSLVDRVRPERVVAVATSLRALALVAGLVALSQSLGRLGLLLCTLSLAAVSGLCRSMTIAGMPKLMLSRRPKSSSSGVAFLESFALDAAWAVGLPLGHILAEQGYALVVVSVDLVASGLLVWNSTMIETPRASIKKDGYSMMRAVRVAVLVLCFGAPS